MKIAFIGAGNMAAALIGGLLKRGTDPADILAIDPHEETRDRRASQFHIDVAATPDDRLRDFDVVVIAVKPQAMKKSCEALTRLIDRQLFISVAAGVRTSTVCRWLGNYERVIRAMPNTPALVGAGMTALFAAAAVSITERARATQIFDSVGSVLWVDSDESIDAVTAISGSGPAYVFYFLEALQRAAQQFGLTDEQGRTLALTTFTGATRLACESEQSIASLRESVTSKNGTTAAALDSFATSGISQAIVLGACAARERAIELGSELDRAE